MSDCKYIENKNSFILFQEEEKNNQKKNLSIQNLKNIIERFLLQTDVTPSSRLTYKRGLNSFYLWYIEKFEKNDLFILNRESLIEYKNFLDEKNLQPFTRSLYLVCIRQFFSWTESILLYPNIAKGIKGLKRLNKLHNKDSLSKESVIMLLNSIEKISLHGMRDYVLIYLLVHTGLRLIEVSGILISDIERDPVKGTAKVWVRGKGRDGKDAFVILLPEVLKIIDIYLKKRGEIEKETVKEYAYLFISHNFHKIQNKSRKRMSTQSLSRIIRLRMKNANIKSKRISAHSLRHTFGVMAIRGGASLYEVQLAMRHSSPSTTQVYLGDIEQMKREEASPELRVREMLKID
jgi:integrase/recombinase XerD